LGQIEEASLCELAGARFADKAANVSTALGVVEPDALPLEFTVEPSVDFMSGVVAQIQTQENMDVPRHQCERRCAPEAF
jgi:hypothetical protein